MVYDLGGFVLSLALLLKYHGYLRLRLRDDPGYAVDEVTTNARMLWVKNVMSGDERDVLTAQTLRNSEMAKRWKLD